MNPACQNGLYAPEVKAGEVPRHVSTGKVMIIPTEKPLTFEVSFIIIITNNVRFTNESR
jgi:hypothetical protein